MIKVDLKQWKIFSDDKEITSSIHRFQLIYQSRPAVLEIEQYAMNANGDFILDLGEPYMHTVRITEFEVVC